MTTNTKETVEAEHQNIGEVNIRRIRKVTIKDENIPKVKQNRAKVDDLDQGLRVDGDDPDLLLIREMTDLHRETDIGGLEVDLGLSLTTGNHHTTDHADPRREVEDPHPILEEDADLTLGGPDHPVPELEDSEDQGRIVAGGVRGHTDIEISPPPFWIIQVVLFIIISFSNYLSLTYVSLSQYKIIVFLLKSSVEEFYEQICCIYLIIVNRHNY